MGRRPDSPLKQLYLTLFNGVSMIGWGYILYLWAMYFISKDAFRTFPNANGFWEIVREPLNIVQSLALLEIVHVLLGFTRSPLASTLPQVFSRIFLLWAVTNQSERCQNHLSVYLFVGSWGMAEIPRYFFYVLRNFMDLNNVPYPIKFLRYSLFLALYPTGISGELIQMIIRIPETAQTGWFYWFVFVIVGYAPAAPFLYNHMRSQRQKVLYPRPARREEGIVFPKDNDGNRSTMKINHACWCESVKKVDDRLYQKITKIKPRSWRWGYRERVVDTVISSAGSKEKCLEMAKQGLKFIHEKMLFIRYENKQPVEMPLRDAMEKYDGTFLTGKYEGEKREEFLGEDKQRDFVVPYKGKNVKGKKLEELIRKWEKYGTIEKSCAEAMIYCVKNPEKCDLRDKYFVLLGATSAMGPLQVLLTLGANIIAVDLDRDFIWSKIFALVKESPGTVTFPMKSKMQVKLDKEFYMNCGCNLLTEIPEIANWLCDLYPKEELIIGGYAYLDGALFLKISVAMDAIMEKVLRTRGRGKAAIAFLCSPTDVFTIPTDAFIDQQKNYEKSPFYQHLMETLNKYVLKNVIWPKKNPQERYCFENDNGKRVCINNGLVMNQGPNYALSKRIQHWRCMLEKENGFVVSSNIAPSTRTESVVHNFRFEIGYSGLHLFKPMEVMDQKTSNAVMTSLLLFDVQSSDSVSHPDIELEHPLDLFREGGFHGGIWRNGFQIESCASTSAFHFFLTRKLSWVLGFFGAVAGICAGSVALRARWMK